MNKFTWEVGQPNDEWRVVELLDDAGTPPKPPVREVRGKWFVKLAAVVTFLGLVVWRIFLMWVAGI